MPKTPDLKTRLTAKVGPLPVYAWAVIAVGGFYLWNHYRSTSSQNASVTPQGSDTAGMVSGDTGAGAGGGSSSGDNGAAGSGSGYNGTSDLLTQLLIGQAEQTAELQRLGSSQTGSDQGPSTPQPSAGSSSGTTSNGGASVHLPGVIVPPLPPGVGATVVGNTVLVGQDAKGHPLLPTGVTGKGFGGVVSVKKLANGATLTTFGSGRQVEQLPGKTPYVVKK